MMFRLQSLLIIALLSSLGSGFAVWKIQAWKYGNQIAEIREEQHKKEIEQAAALIAAVEEVRIVEQKRYKALQEAEREAREREQVQRVAAAAARAESDSLRDNLSALKAGLPGLTERAVREYASTLAGLLGDCTAEYQQMAETAQRHAGDVKLLIDAWPEK